MTEIDQPVQTIEEACGFLLVWSVQHHWANFKAFEIVSREDDGRPSFEFPDCIGGDYTTDWKQVDPPYLDGYVKWDGCSGIRSSEHHWCGPCFYKKHIALLEHIYRQAYVLMGREPEETWEEAHAITI